jgi:hypothetical protein
VGPTHARGAWLYFTGAVTLPYVKYLVEPAPTPAWVWAAQYVPLYALLIAAWARVTLRRRSGHVVQAAA